MNTLCVQNVEHVVHIVTTLLPTIDLALDKRCLTVTVSFLWTLSIV
jgi:hypothetical protein